MVDWKMRLRTRFWPSQALILCLPGQFVKRRGCVVSSVGVIRGPGELDPCGFQLPKSAGPCDS
jgi:hypothetical protein